MSSKSKFGTFGGVFTPCTLTILGVIMFLRLGTVVGQSGFINAIIILAAAKTITLLTTISLSAISTNTRVKGGGAYFMISRSLGVEFGTAIGCFFFLAQAISVSMYVVGFTEAFMATFNNIPFSFVTVATIVNVISFIFVFIGAGWTIKFQFGILAILLISIGSFFLGAAPLFSVETLMANATPAYTGQGSFFIMFALFFPAVTGIMAGANMSGDLRDPARSIPAGTFSSITVTGIIYVVMILLLAGANTQQALIADTMIIRSNALYPALIPLGIFSATLSSALGSMMGAPRILQSLAKDKVFSWLKPFAATSGGEPRTATIATFVIAQVAIMAGNLNSIAPVITMFFMLTYGTLNLACFYEAYSRNPSFRPSFRYYSWVTGLLGCVSCMGVMFLINALWAVVSIGCMGLLFWFVSRAGIVARWGDVSSGLALERARKALLKLEDERYHPKNWRPIILALSTRSWKSNNLSQFGHWLAAGRGILSLAQILYGDIEDKMVRRDSAERLLRKFIADEELEAFPVVIVDEGLEDGIKALLQCHGIGGLRPNTLLIGFREAQDDPSDYILAITHAMALEKNIVCIRQNQNAASWETTGDHINILWEGMQDGLLMLIFAHLIIENNEWRRHELVLLVPATPQTDRDGMTEKMRTILSMARVKASIRFIEEDESVAGCCSGRQGLTLRSMPRPSGSPEEYVNHLRELTEGMGDTILVASAGDVTVES
ncbi:MULTISPECIES: amino acid permease [unclassified Pseudodesulfovibrio]|uniref:amino acid permease n=1 Tax=unclassified Pseudodesulfovibrio TaxID=2661612 RepID=UPI000FEB8C78|nr:MULTISPECIES: amino acid permease [unclassified Pseudodesulfovibrio]MCJ2164714.1 amino acid permease [Pseudodesulfovibrio sp. S3-i]RWU04097.1 amino acid permease [Pseudodesulfovibrio sp. S3]